MLPTGILKYIKDHHVLHLCTVNGDAPWGCNVFYVFDEAEVRFFILSEMKTRHAQYMTRNPKIAGTVTAHPRFIASIQGVQFSGLSKRLEGVEAEPAYAMYYKRFAVARVLNAPIWELRLDYIKMTNNKIGFAFKDEWNRSEQL